MARAVARRSKADFISAASLGVRMTALLTIPAGVGLFVLRRPLIGVALEYRNFTAEDALQASRALAGLALGLGAFSIYLFVVRAFYAHQDTKTAFKVNVVENTINIILAFVLVGSFGVLGLGASFAIAYIVSALWALQILTYKVPGFTLREVLASLARIIVAAALMGESVWFVANAFEANTGGGAILRLMAGTLVGIVVYFGLLAAMGATELDALRRRLPGRTRSTPD
jgi:putative peptidoglycan lipid II flippase